MSTNRSLIILMTLISACACQQKFAEQPEYTEVNRDGVTVLRCKIANIGGKCSWLKDGFVVGMERSKYEWAGDPGAGDCSLTVRGADLVYDQGQWACQVSASSFKNQDMLSSAPAKLLVRIRPELPVLQYSGIELQRTGQGQVSVKEATDVPFQCRVAKGNPAATIAWYIGERELPAELSQQRNISDGVTSSTFTAVSTLRYSFSRGDKGQTLYCVAKHGAYEQSQHDAAVKINLEYAPETEILGIPEQELEENLSSIQLRCNADSNPPAKIQWMFVSAESGDKEVFFRETLEFKPVVRTNAGTYQCLAENSVGKSQPLTAQLDVKYSPTILSMTPSRSVTVALGNSTDLHCQAGANPAPSYQWLHRPWAPDGAVHVRGQGATLRIDNVSYNNAGSYVCVARNVIGGEERRTQSQSVDIQVTGGPQLLRQHMSSVVEVGMGERGDVSAVFCSNPHPVSAVWRWGDVKLAAGKRLGRFQAEPLKADVREHCYQARLLIDLVSRDDQRRYSLEVINDVGADEYGVSLRVKEPVTMTTVIVIISACLLLLVLVVSLLLYSYKTDKCCFSQKSGFKPTDLESEKSEFDGIDAVKSPGVIPPDALYAAPRKSHIRQSPITSQCDGENSSIEYSNGLPHSGGQMRAPSRGSVIYADLQLPKTSNNGSMRKQRTHGHRIGATPTDRHSQSPFNDSHCQRMLATPTDRRGQSPFNDGQCQRADI